MKRQPQRAVITLAAERVMSPSILIAKQPAKQSPTEPGVSGHSSTPGISPMHSPTGHNASFFLPSNFLPILEKFPLCCLQLASWHLCAAAPHED